MGINNTPAITFSLFFIIPSFKDGEQKKESIIVGKTAPLSNH